MILFCLPLHTKHALQPMLLKDCLSRAVQAVYFAKKNFIASREGLLMLLKNLLNMPPLVLWLMYMHHPVNTYFLSVTHNCASLTWNCAFLFWLSVVHFLPSSAPSLIFYCLSFLVSFLLQFGCFFFLAILQDFDSTTRNF